MLSQKIINQYEKTIAFLLSFFAVFALGLTGCSDDPDVKLETPVIKASNPADIAAVAGKEQYLTPWIMP